MTNGDWIRTMDDEQLSKLCTVIVNSILGVKIEHPDWKEVNENYTKRIYAWLKQEEDKL